MGDNNRKICFIVPDLNKGGMERIVAELANYFSLKPNTIVHIILLTSNAGVFYKISEVVVLHKPSFLFNNRIRTISTLRTLLYLRRKVKEIRPDAILSFGETYNSFVLLSTLNLNLRVYVSDRSRPDKRWGLFHESLRRVLYPKAAGIISQTKYSEEFLRKETRQNNIRVIPNPVRRIFFENSNRENVILYVGRLTRTKRLDLLLEIYCRCQTDGWELWLVGDGEREEVSYINRLVDEYNIASRVRLWGKQEDIDKFYLTAKIFAFTSESEGLPNVLLEAMSAGLACISFDCVAGPRDLIEDGLNGYLVRLYDLETYVARLNLLIHDTCLRESLSKNALERSKDFNLHLIGEQFYNFLLT